MWVDTAHPQNGREPRIANKFKAIRDLASFKDEGLAALTRDAEAMLEATSQIDKIAQEILSKLQKPTSEHAESEDH
jgi:molybdenum-dependent DNA-binding transcriptional regulator ModE